MAKRPTKRRTATTYREVAYKPEVHDELFRLASADWTRPRHLHVSNQARGLTFDANFTSGEGVTYACRIRIRRYADGELAVAEETLSVRFHLRSEGAAK